MTDFMRDLLSAGIKNNPNMMASCLFGMLELRKDGVFNGLDHLSWHDKRMSTDKACEVWRNEGGRRGC